MAKVTSHHHSHSMKTILALLLGYVVVAHGAPPTWKAGTAKAIITPTEPLWLAGYGGRDKPAEGKATDLWLKVLALEDAAGHRAVILTSDLLGFPQSIYHDTCAALRQQCRLAPDQIILSASHTHCGPVLRGALYDIYPLDDDQRVRIEKYSTWLEAKIIETVGQALADLAPARLAAGQGMTAFAVNRRNNLEGDVPGLIQQGALKGPVDHAVPVLAVFRPDGTLKAVLFGYACHNTTMAFYQWCGDYAGFAQQTLELSHTNATAMFFMGCGADQNPLPRRQLELARRYGQMLAAAVEEVLLAPPHSLSPRLVTKMEMVPLHLGAVPTPAELETMTADKSASNRRWATRLLAQLKDGRPFPREYPFPLQAWKLGDRQLLLTLGGEPVVDYALKFKREFDPDTWVAGYCNDVMTYLPSLRVLKEDLPPLANARWGYEGSHGLVVYGLPAFRWAEDVDDLITDATRRLVKQVNAVAK
jgi:neutral ceramidase